jgi:hypothetical protein
MTQETEIKPGPYRHFKGGLYYVTGLSVFEETGEWLVHFVGTDGKPWTRRYSVFRELVTVDGVETPRFSRLSQIGWLDLHRLQTAVHKMHNDAINAVETGTPEMVLIEPQKLSLAITVQQLY